MIISNNTDIRNLSKIRDGEKLEITKELALNKSFLTMLATRFPNSDITVLSGYNAAMTQYSSQQPFFDTKETQVFIENLNYLRSKFSKDITFDDMFSAEQALEATRNFNATVKHIKSLKVNGRPLSPLERFYAAYNYVTQKMYNEVDLIENSALSRNLINVLTTDKIVCVGYTNWLIALLNELDIPCTYQPMITQDPNSGELGNHATLAVRIVDPVYRVNGIFHSDPTADASKEKFYSLGLNSFELSLVPYAKLSEVYTCGFEFDKTLSSIDGTVSGQVFENRTPKLLSALFPDITHHRTQDVIISSVINESIKSTHIKENLVGFVGMINQDHIDDSLERQIRELLDANKFCSELASGTIKSHLNAISITLISLGLTRDEACEYISKYLTEENIRQFYISKNEELKKPAADEVIKKSTDKALLQVSKLQSLVQKYHIENIDMPSDFEILKSVSQNLCRTCIYNTFSCEQPKPFDLAEITALQRKGYPLEDILESLKEMVEGEDLFEHYLYHNTHLTAPLKHPEDEFYLGLVQPFYILNQPYEELFYELASRTGQIKAKDIRQVFENLFIAEGCSIESARRQATTALKSTNLSNPAVFEQ